MKSLEIHRKGRWLLVPYVRLVIDHDLGAAASHIQSLSRLQVASHVVFYPSQSYFIWRLTPVTTKMADRRQLEKAKSVVLMDIINSLL